MCTRNDHGGSVSRHGDSMLKRNTGAEAKSAYLAAVRPVRAALGTFTAEKSKWSSTDDFLDQAAIADTEPVIAALQSFSLALADDQWPASLSTAVHTLSDDTGALTGDVENLSALSETSVSAWNATYDRDDRSMVTAINRMVHDLGLPPLGVQPSTQTPATIPPSPATPPTTASPITTTTVPTVGGTINLGGQGEGNYDFEVTLSRVVPLVNIGDISGYRTVQPGYNQDAFEFVVTDTGPAPVNEDIFNDLKVYDSQGQGFGGDIGTEYTGGPSFPGGLIDVTPGGTATGWVVVDVPVNQPLATVVFTPGGGFAPSAPSATWTLAS
jgi:hypothetical protein